MKKLFALLLAFALFAAACGDDGGDDAADAEGGDAAVEDDSSGDGDSDAPADDGEPADEEPADEEPADDPVELTASSDGVTAETIKIGIASIDTEALLQFGFDLGNVPLEPLLDSWATTLNDNGGVNGRTVELVYDIFLPIGDDEQAETCLIMMEDENVFMVIGQFVGDNPLCITETYGRPYVGHFGETPDRQERSNGLFFATEISQLPQRIGGVTRMIQNGDLDGKAVALTWGPSVDAVYADAVRPILADAGINVVQEIEIGDFGEDQVAADDAWDVAIEVIQSAGAEVIVHVSNIVPPLDALGRAEVDDITLAFTNGQAADGTTVVGQSTAPDSVRENSFAITTFKPSAEEGLADPGVVRCLDEFEAAGGDMSTLELDNDDFANGIVNWCRAFRLTTAILEAAGPDLNPESFIAGGESLGDIALPAMAEGSITADKHSAGGLLIRYEYVPDDEDGQYVAVGEPFSAFG
ncbi:MAG: ABC transporter substrate-binding protein [Actinomycetota bacterium]